MTKTLQERKAEAREAYQREINMNRDINKLVSEQPMTEGISGEYLIWKIHYKNEDGSINWIHAYCKSQEEAKELFSKDTESWIGNLKYEFLYAEIVGELILSQVMQSLIE